jgi:TatD family-associated radical SAM protein
MKTADIIYEFHGAYYVNLTNKCPNLCKFCIKNTAKMNFRGYNLNLQKKEPSVNQVIKIIDEKFKENPLKEIVFCGYGEPVCRLDELLEISRHVKNHYPKIKIRINTNGMGNLVWKRDIVPQLKGLVDSVCISLNTANAEQWIDIMKPDAEYVENGFIGVLSFISSSVSMLPETIITAVDLPEVDTEEVRKLANNMKAKFRLRPMLDESEM